MSRLISLFLVLAVSALFQAPIVDAQSGCTNVSGTISGKFITRTTIAGTVTGDLAGQVGAIILDMRPSGSGAVHVQLQHEFVTGSGDALDTMDQAVLSPVSPPVYEMNTDYTITGGTGIFQNAAGFLRNHGYVAGGQVSLSYHGRICGLR